MNLQIYEMDLMTEDVKASEKEYDYFVLAPNVEKRSREAFLKLKGKAAIRNVVIMDYKNFHKDISDEQELSFFRDFEGEAVARVQEGNDTQMMRELIKSGIREEDHIALDITGFSIPNIYRIINIFKNVLQIKHLDVYYTEPKFYIFEEGYFSTYHTGQSRRYKERRCESLPGYCNSGRDEKEVLVIFLGFDGGLAGQVFFNLAEDGQEIMQTFAVNGFPSYTAKLKDVSLFNNEDFIIKIGRENVRYAMANNPFDAYNLLCDIKKNYSEFLLNLCTIGSKPMALGTCLFALDHLEEVKVTYPFYEKTQFDSDEEPGKIWRYGIDL